MQIIVPHAGPDLDALGAALAARLLYPQGRIVLQGGSSPGAADFASLHRYQIEALSPRAVDLAAVELVVAVDTQDPDRLGALAALVRRPAVRVHVYDHHPRQPDGLAGEVEVVESVGATCTLMAELLQEAGLRPEPFVGTAMLLGIYADTGNLLLPSTTARDAYAAGWLLECGASLRAASTFLSVELTPAQQELLAQLEDSWQLRRINGIKVGMAAGRAEHYVGGLAHIIHHLQGVRPAPATFIAVQMEGRIHVIGRSEVGWLDVARVLQAFGGGGHAGAASAVVRTGTLDEVVDRLAQVVAETAAAPVTAANLMKQPVRAVPENLEVREAHRLMLRYGHTGLPVVDGGGAVLGVISRRDVEKALRAELGHAPVKGFMSRPAITVSPETGLDQIQSLMLDHDIGRLPVLDGGELVGIVTRTDVLGELYDGSPPHWHRQLGRPDRLPPDSADVIRRRVEQLPAPLREVLATAGQVARESSVPAYAVGGFVRDLLLSRPNLDLDIVVEGDGVAFARGMGRRLGAEVQEVDRFGTAHLYRADAPRVDVASARREFYEFAAALPQVEQADLRADLERRDFTINAMAFRLSPEGPGPLLDFFGGYGDLAAGLVRVLHSLSFVEDPTRALRGVRFACRYGFRLEPETERLIADAAAAGIVGRVSRERLAAELLAILAEVAAPAALALLDRLGVLGRILPEVAWDGPRAARLTAVGDLVTGHLGPADLAAAVQPWFLRALALCLEPADAAAGLEAIRRLRLARRQAMAAETVLSGWTAARKVLSAPDCVPSQVVAALREWPSEGVALLWLAAHQEQHQKMMAHVAAFWSTHRHVRAAITGRDLRRSGVPPGPVYSRVLARVLAARLDGQVAGRAAELDLALRLLDDHARTDGGGHVSTDDDGHVSTDGDGHGGR